MSCQAFHINYKLQSQQAERGFLLLDSFSEHLHWVIYDIIEKPIQNLYKEAYFLMSHYITKVWNHFVNLGPTIDHLNNRHIILNRYTKHQTKQEILVFDHLKASSEVSVVSIPVLCWVMFVIPHFIGPCCHVLIKNLLYWCTHVCDSTGYIICLSIAK